MIKYFIIGKTNLNAKYIKYYFKLSYAFKTHTLCIFTTNLSKLKINNVNFVSSALAFFQTLNAWYAIMRENTLKVREGSETRPLRRKRTKNIVYSYQINVFFRLILTNSNH